jgi:hypothetical protein
MVQATSCSFARRLALTTILSFFGEVAAVWSRLWDLALGLCDCLGLLASSC